MYNRKKAEAYNISGRNEITNLQIVDRVCSILNEKVPTDKSYKKLITFIKDRAGYDKRYAIDAKKLENKFGWKACHNFDSGIIKTMEWYLDKYNAK